MSCSLYWKPRSKKQYRVEDIQLREILRHKYGYPSLLDCSCIPYLEALADADINGASELLESIRKHDEIEIFLE